MKMLYLVLILSLMEAGFSARILCVFPVTAKSHQLMLQSVWKELVIRGHQVTVLTPDPINDTNLKNLTEIDMSFTYDIVEKINLQSKYSKNNNLIFLLPSALNLLERIIKEHIIKSEEIFTNSNKSFDLVLVQTLHPLVYAFGCKFNVPIIGISTTDVYLHTHDAVGNPTHPVISPGLIFSRGQEFGLYDRIRSVFYSIWYRIFYYGYILPRNDKIVKEHFGENCPYLGDIEKNVSLVFVNKNPILSNVRPNVPAMIQIEQIHIKPKKPLPEDLQNFLDQSQQGAVYFSLGTNVNMVKLPENFKRSIVKALAQLPYNVIMKWEMDNMPNQPKNIITRKWLPQQDILGNKNIKVFITQGGLHSIEEAITNGVPLVGMPFMTDQPANVFDMVKKGVCIAIDPYTITEEIFIKAILEVAENPKYREKARHLKNLLSDQPIKGLDKLIWWTEYVIRHKGARHLKSAAVDIPWYQYFLLDVLLVFLCVLIILFYVTSTLIKLVLHSIFKKRVIKTKKD